MNWKRIKRVATAGLAGLVLAGTVHGCAIPLQLSPASNPSTSSSISQEDEKWERRYSNYVVNAKVNRTLGEQYAAVCADYEDDGKPEIAGVVDLRNAAGTKKYPITSGMARALTTSGNVPATLWFTPEASDQLNGNKDLLGKVPTYLSNELPRHFVSQTNRKAFDAGDFSVFLPEEPKRTYFVSPRIGPLEDVWSPIAPRPLTARELADLEEFQLKLKFSTYSEGDKIICFELYANLDDLPPERDIRAFLDVRKTEGIALDAQQMGDECRYMAFLGSGPWEVYVLPSGRNSLEQNGNLRHQFSLAFAPNLPKTYVTAGSDEGCELTKGNPLNILSEPSPSKYRSGRIIQPGFNHLLNNVTP